MTNPSSNPNQVLLVIDELIVGPVQLEANRLQMPYTVVKGEERQTNTLVYKYEEPVFDPDNLSDYNLASMMGAQLALNYGLFCKTITFDGVFDQSDKRFLLDMMENTAREILVHKIYSPNPFLMDMAKGLPVTRQKRYTQATVQFTDTREKDQPLQWETWDTDLDRHCVLSSGGKDSLLGYGLLKELGKTVYPIFGNESGRHWFTALNGYRYLKANEPNTGRVWMNSDRIFAWMLRQLPFIRPDFADVRADDYPIRLWTVAVFLFGVLPMMKKHQMGRLVIGDEYDSTQRGNFQGITHYHGLYDQSRFFDEALSRYYLKKGWNISQFSLLRSMSELLILKTLVERYPELQAQQVSCHAAHEKDGRIYPCGKCEKCRRIVGMLTALDGDPANCGYSPVQVQQALGSLATHKVKQLGSDASHLYALLAQKGVIESGASVHPEIMHLRFDKERSRIDGIPMDLRIPLYTLLLEKAEGALQRRARRWQAIDLLKEPEVHQRFVFETESPEYNKMTTPRKNNYLWAQLSWEEAKARLQETDIALLPVGAIEQHGPHLPLDVDAFDAELLAQRVAEACSEPKPLVLPLVPYGVSYHHDDFPGTISISNEAMATFICDIGKSVARQGIKKLVIVNGHGDNAPTLNYAAQIINRDTGIFVCVDTGETSDADIEPLSTTPNDIHAGEIETSTTLAVRPHLVNQEKASDMTVQFNNRYLNFSSKYFVPWYVATHKISADGVLGDPTKATVEKGQKIWQIMIGHLVAFVETIKEMPLEEIYQRKY